MRFLNNFFEEEKGDLSPASREMDVT